MIEFFRGTKKLYDLNAHGNGIYFAIDTQEIIHNGLIFSGNIPQELIDKINSNSAKLEVFNESSIQNQINTAFNDFVNNVSDDNSINTFKELVDYTAETGKGLNTLILEVDTIKTELETTANEITLLETRDAEIQLLLDKNTEDIKNLSTEIDQKIETAFSWQNVN
jgi:hypothetical protein